MAKSHPARCIDYRVSRQAQFARSTAASYLMLAFLAVISIVLHKQFKEPLVGAINQTLAVLEPIQSAAAEDPVAVPAIEPVAADPNGPKHRAIGEYLARRYRVSVDMTTGIVNKAYEIGRSFKVDPLLILAVIAVESRFNPVAESAMGAKGLMQVIPRYHPEKFSPLGGEKVAFDARANITVGAGILKEYIRKTGDVGDALQMYVGATSDESENGYSSKVLLERERLYQILRQHQVREGAI